MKTNTSGPVITPNPSTPEATKHTPGPFFFKRGRGVDPRDFIVVDSTGNTVAETNIALYVDDGLQDIDPSVRPITIEEAIANSHLFAAAPDMLAALKAMVADDAFVDLCQGIGHEPEWLKSARLAIVKVGGQ